MTRGAKRADVFSPWVRRIVLGAVFVSSVAVVVALLWGAKFALPTAGEADSLGGGPIGHRLFAETLEAAGKHVLQNRSDRYEAATAPMLFIEPTHEARVEGRLHRLRDALQRRSIAGGGSVVVLPKWTFQVGFIMDGAVRPVDATRLNAVVESVFVGTTAAGAFVVAQPGRVSQHTLDGILGSFVIDVPELQTFVQVPLGATVLLDSEYGAVVMEAADGTLVVSDPDLIHTFNFHRADHAALWFALLERFDSDTVVIDESFHGHGKVLSLKEALGQFPTVLLVAHGLAILLLLLMLGSKRFGPPEEKRGYGAGPQEAIAVSASVLADGQSIGQLTYNYVVEVLQDLHRQLGLPDTGSMAARAARIDETAKQRRVPPVAVQLLNEANALGEGKKKHAEAWRIARAAFGFRTRLAARPRLGGDETRAGT